MSAADRRVAVVTGANRGIGLELVRQLAGDGFTAILGARDPAKGAAAAEPLQADGLDDDGPTGGFFRDGRQIDW